VTASDSPTPVTYALGRDTAEAERLRQITLRERGGREAVGLPLNELSAIVEARRKLAQFKLDLERTDASKGRTSFALLSSTSQLHQAD